MKSMIAKSCLAIFILIEVAFAQSIIVDHSCTKISQIPTSAIETAKQNLHIGYGHTSHGSQISSGMSGLVNFMNGKGYPQNLFAWNATGANGALHFYEGDGYGSGDLDHDAGYYPLWVEETRSYLGTPTAQGRGGNHPEMNVIMWSWCGQLSSYSSDDVQTKYLDEMNQLETDYNGIKFVYMTGHSDGSGLQGTLHTNNQKIRDYCVSHNKILFDFYDIECYDPDGNYFGGKEVSDNCSYSGGNWAQTWQNSHQEGQDWYQCESAHSEPLNANLKAYAAWWMWARIAGWDGTPQGTGVEDEDASSLNGSYILEQNYPNPFNGGTMIRFTLRESGPVKLSLFNATGQFVATYVDGRMNAGVHSLRMDLKGLPSGTYYCHFQFGASREIRRLVYLK